jgi:hypothetical protein
LNISLLDKLETVLFTEENIQAGSRLCFIFYGEFSLVRAPARSITALQETNSCSCLKVRSLDRKRSENLIFPHLFLLSGGYQKIYGAYPVGMKTSCANPVGML